MNPSKPSTRLIALPGLRRGLGWGLLAGLMVLGGADSGAFAQGRARGQVAAEAPSAETLKLEREVRELQQKLQVVNVEVKALKQGSRNLSTDYRLRQKLADAEALGRKLTETEARLRGQDHAGGSGRAMAPAGPAPQAAATDGPAELAAKADIMLDQAQKLMEQADRIEHRGARERQRSTLRARARHLEQDPFVGLESSKRNIAFSRSAAAVNNNQPERGGDSFSDGPESLPAPPVPTTDSASAPLPVGGASSGPQPSGEGRIQPGSVPLSPDTSAGSVSVAFRALLDAGTLSQIERIEGSGDPRARAKALAAVVEALRKQASHLQQQAGALRLQR